MSFGTDLHDVIIRILQRGWKPRTGIVVPEVDTVALSGEVVQIEASVLFADLARSTYLVSRHNEKFAADVIRVFLDVASRCIRHQDGEIRSFDGDRVMGVYIGEGHSERAVRSALELHGTMLNDAIPQLQKSWTFDTDYRVGYGCGVDAGRLNVMRAGIHIYNDLVFVGHATNVAAKLSQERATKPILITSDVLLNLQETNLLTDSTGQNIWWKMHVEKVEKVIYGTDGWIY